ncbi:MAG: HD domain-containing protein [Tagaea sp.]
MPDRLDSILDFLILVDRFKKVERRAFLGDLSRRENSAEHSWHMAVVAMVLARETGFAGDLGRVLSMVLVHDLVEIYAGDAFAYDAAARAAAAEKEDAAAKKLFGALPPDLGAEFDALWREFEARETPEAKLAYACDRVQGFLQAYLSDGSSWIEAKIKREQTWERTRPARELDPKIEALILRIYARSDEAAMWDETNVAVPPGKGIVR